MPPAFGMAAPNSAAERAPSKDTAPPATQTRIVGSDAPRLRAITLGTMKIADAMIVPTLIIVESSSPSWRLSSGTTQPVPVRLLQEGAVHEAARIPGGGSGGKHGKQEILRRRRNGRALRGRARPGVRPQDAATPSPGS